ncbi:MAG: hypothetical protein O7D34_08430 [Ignavibacteria bacterium]|nr:hypothetical protein [Ignavibacteria bacterium]
MQAQRGHITLKVFNVLGKELATLITQNFPSEVTELSGMQMASQVDYSRRVYRPGGSWTTRRAECITIA